MAPLLLLLLLPVLLLLSSSPYVQAQQNIITLGSSLTPQGPSSYWLSPSGDFAFGFRPIGDNTSSSSSSYLLAIWFDKISDKTVAWYAKTTDPTDPQPVQVSSSSRLQLNSNGALLLEDPTGIEVWNPQVVGATHASMLDSGNFMLAGPDGSAKWETFKNPADTILLTQVLSTGMKLCSQIIPTNYSNGRFLLNLQSDGAFVYFSNEPPAHYPNDSSAYWFLSGHNTTNLVFNTTGAVYITLADGAQISMTSGVNGSMADYYHRATLDPDGVFRQYLFPKKVSNLNSQAWSVVDFKPPNICDPLLAYDGRGACRMNSYCMFNSTDSQSICMCPKQYSYVDKEMKYKGCNPDFQQESCGLDKPTDMMQFKSIQMSHVDWPGVTMNCKTTLLRTDASNSV
ncbi:unnamed protein product [Urochloa humidicola]